MSEHFKYLYGYKILFIKCVLLTTRVKIFQLINNNNKDIFIFKSLVNSNVAFPVT